MAFSFLFFFTDKGPGFTQTSLMHRSGLHYFLRKLRLFLFAGDRQWPSGVNNRNRSEVNAVWGRPKIWKLSVHKRARKLYLSLESCSQPSAHENNKTWLASSKNLLFHPGLVSAFYMTFLIFTWFYNRFKILLNRNISTKQKKQAGKRARRWNYQIKEEKKKS